MSWVLEVIQEIAMAFSTQIYYSVGWYQLFYFQYMVLQIQNIILYHTVFDQVTITSGVTWTPGNTQSRRYYTYIPKNTGILPNTKANLAQPQITHTYTCIQVHICMHIHILSYMASKFCSRNFPTFHIITWSLQKFYYWNFC